MALYKKGTNEKFNSGDYSVSPVGTVDIFDPGAPTRLASLISTRSSRAPQLQFEEAIEVARPDSKVQLGTSTKRATTPTQIYEEAREVAAPRDGFDRAGAILTGAGQQWGSGFVNTLGTTQKVTGGVMRENYLTTDLATLAKDLSRAEYEVQHAVDDADKQYWQMELERIKKSIIDRQTGLEETKTAGDKAQKIADDLAKAGQADVEYAKQGLGKVGQFGVDVAVGATQLAMDIGAGVATGGGAMVPMAIRGFGSGAQEARQNGGTLGQQLAYGLAGATVEALTEKLFSVGNINTKAFGKGKLDDIFKGIVAAVEDYGKTPAGKKALNHLASAGTGFVTEYIEEFASGVSNPFLQHWTYDKDSVLDPFQIAKDAAYEALVGGSIGMLTGGVGGTNTNAWRAEQAQKGKGVDKAPTTAQNNKETSPAAAPQVQQMEAQEKITRTENPESDVLDTATTMFVELGMKLKTAQQKAEIVKKLIAGEEVSVKDINRLEPTSKRTQAIFTQLTGVQFPETGLTTERLYNLYRSANTVAQEARVAAKTVEAAPVEDIQQLTPEQILERAAEARKNLTPEIEDQAAMVLAQARGEIAPDGKPLVTFEQFSQIYRENVDPKATRESIARVYQDYLTDNATVSYRGRRVSHQKFMETLKSAPGGQQLTEAELEGLWQAELELQKQDGKDAAEHSSRDPQAEKREQVQKSVNEWKKVLVKNSSVTDILLDETLAENENAYIDSTGVVHLNAKRMDSADAVTYVLGHELVHSVNDAASRIALVNDIIDTVRKLTNATESREEAVKRYQDLYQKHEDEVAKRENRKAQKISLEYAEEEYAADLMREVFMSGDMLSKLAAERPSLLARIQEIVQKWIASLKGNREAVELYNELNRLQDHLVEALRGDAVQGKIALENAGIEVDADTDSARHSLYSLTTWTESDYVLDRDKAAAALAKSIGVSEKKAQKYIDDVNSVAKLIADDKVRLDYDAAPGRSSFVGNSEYGGSIDFSTICKKRRLFTGTFSAIQKALPNTALTPGEMIDIRKRMKDKGHEVSCGLCYVEGSRLNLGQYATQFLDQYADGDVEYVPTLPELTTVDGQEDLRREHPEAYEAYMKFLNTLAQRKPKVYQTATAYNGEVLKKFSNDSSVAEKNANGGLRLQSFSDFEIVHLIDNMQVITDMARVGLAGQAYTKVPDFAWAMGNTGLKINLSLIAKDVDADGRLVLDDVEGMPRSDAEALRSAYSDNVGTIIVVFNDAQLKAAMADDFIDYIIPFHRSQLSKKQYDGLGLPEGAKDYTMVQNESYIEPVLKNGKKQRPSNYMPNTYWDFSKTGKENAEAYLEMCAKNNRRPKFSNVLEYNGDGSYSLPADGSADGYWKLLIDFKMYNNDGVGVPQQPVKPDFNLDEAQRMLSEYKGGHSNFPVAQDVVDEFVEDYKKRHPGKRYSIAGWKPNLDNTEWGIVNSVMNSGRGTELTAIGTMFFETSKGKSVFGIYSTDDNTLLYASRGEAAMREHQYVEFVKEEYNNGGLADTSTKGIRALAERARMQSAGNSGDNSTNGGSARSGRHVGVYAGQPRLHASRALENVLSNLLKAEESRRANSVTEQPTQASEKSGASSLPKYSIDSDGDALTEAQQEFFKNSKARDHMGRLMTMYHGTKSFGFTVFDPQFSDDGRSLFFTDRVSTSRTYTGTKENDIRALNKDSDTSVYDIDPEDIRTDDDAWVVLEKLGYKKLLQDALNTEQLHSTIDGVAETALEEAGLWLDAIESDITQVLGGRQLTAFRNNSLSRLKQQIAALRESLADPESSTKGSLARSVLLGDIEALYNTELDVIEALDYFWAQHPNYDGLDYYEGLKDAISDPELSAQHLQRLVDAVSFNSSAYVVYAPEEGAIHVAEEDLVYEAQRALRRRKKGLYEVYLNLENPLIIDANESNWNALDHGDLTEDGLNEDVYWEGETTREIAEYAQENGYDGVIFKNLYDHGHYAEGDEPAATVMIAFRSEQVKSTANANPTSDPDIRYSITNPELSFADQVELVRQNKLNEFLVPGNGRFGKYQPSAVYVAKEPNPLMQELGYGNYPLVVTQQHIRQMMGKREDAAGNVVNEHNHQLTPRQVKILPKLLENPAAVLRAKGRPDSLVFVTTEKDYRGRPVIVPVKANGTQITFDGADGPAHVVTSMYGHDNFAKLWNEAAETNGIFYYNKKRIDPILESLTALSKTETTPGIDPRAEIRVTEIDPLQVSPDTILGQVQPVVKDPGQRKFSITPEFEKWYLEGFENADEHTRAQEILKQLRQKYGDIPTGENPARDVRMPRKNAEGERVHDTVRTVMEAAATPENRLGSIQKAVVDGKFADVPIENKNTARRVREKIKRDGRDKALLNWTSKVRAGEASADLVAEGAVLLNNAGNSAMSGEQYVDLLTDYSDLLHRVGQSLQAARILKTLSPEGKLYGIQKQVNKMNDERRAKAGGKIDPQEWADKHEIKLDPQLVDAYRKAETDAERDAILDQIQQHIADQLPASLKEKLNNWRYLAMLGNFRTQIRNLFGNAAFQIPRIVKETVAGGIEGALAKAGVKIDRTRSAALDRATFSAAWEDFKDVRDIILSGGKVDEAVSYLDGIDSKRRIYKNRILEGYRRVVNTAMDEGDAVFCRFTYADSLARFMAANHTTWENAPEALKERGRRHAIREAAEATYRDLNAFSETVLGLRFRTPGSNPVKKGVNAVVEGVLPFRKTPANVLVRGIEYSPLGLIKASVDAVRIAKGSDKVTGNDVINELAKTLTGSGLFMLGYFMAKNGLLTALGPDDDDKEKAFWELQGNQSYAFVWRGKSYTIDWLAPEAIPVLVGANTAEVAAEEGLDLNTVTKAVTRISDPMLQMSMLQGVNDLIENIANTQTVAALPSLILNSLWSYGLQYVPTLSGQAERAGDNTRRTTYKEADSGTPGGVQYALGKLSQKVPGWDYQQIPYIDQWGRMEENYETELGNTFAQFLSPSYKSVVNTSEMETELQRLYDATGETGVLPAAAPKYFTADGERRNLTADEYVNYATIRGQTAHNLLVELTSSAAYLALDDAGKVTAVKDVYSYAGDVAKAEILGAAPSASAQGMNAAEDYGISKADYTALGAATSGVASLKDASGETITNSRGLQIMEIVYATLPDLTKAQYERLFEDLGVGKTIRGYNKQMVASKLKQMRKQAKQK